MPNRPTVIHPRFTAAVVDLAYPSSIAIESFTVVQDPESGAETRTWSTVTGLGAIPAAIAPVVIAAIGSSKEIIADKETWRENSWHMSLGGYYPAIRQSHRVKLDDGRAFNIVGVEHDSRRQFTRLRAEEIS